MMFAEFYRDDNDGWSDTAVEDHVEILAALERGDKAGAPEHMRLHIINGGAHAIAILEQRGFWNG
jgi:DNA-binding GntR family transcriptional regulator